MAAMEAGPQRKYPVKESPCLTSAPVLILIQDSGGQPTVAGLLRGGVHHLPSFQTLGEVSTFHEDFVPAVVVPDKTNGYNNAASALLSGSLDTGAPELSCRVQSQPNPANCVLRLTLQVLRDYEPDGIPGLRSVRCSIGIEDQVRLQVSSVVVS